MLLAAKRNQKIKQMIQGSPEWFAARCGVVTASRRADLMARTKAGWGASRANYMAQLIAERLTGKPGDSFTSAAMQWGIDNEPLARAAYEFYTDTTVDQVGFVFNELIKESCASPDGLIGKSGLIEIKCPNTATHIETLLSDKINKKYILQMQWQLACTKRQWCDFVSFDCRMPEEMKLFVKRVDRDNELIKDISDNVFTFLEEMNSKIVQLKKKAA